jgi:alpha-N-acetylglucosamine transferase
MKNRNILHARQEVKIYRQYYQPTFNLWRVMKSILGLLFFGTSTVANSYTTTKKRNLK